MEENRKKIHDMVDCMDTDGMLAYWETFMRRWLEYWGHGAGQHGKERRCAVMEEFAK